MSRNDDYDRKIHKDLARELHAELDKRDGNKGEEMDFELHGLLDGILHDAVRERTSDIHIDPRSDGMRVRFRIDGAVIDVVHLSHKEGNLLINQFKTTGDLNPIPSFRAEETRWNYQADGHEFDVRVSSVNCLGGEKLVARLLSPVHVDHAIDQLGVCEQHQREIEWWLENLNGMFLVTGPVGNGKTTTLYALLRCMRKLDKSIVSIENPIEYQLDGVSQLEIDEERGVKSFNEGVKAMLRLDPDCLLLGEIRDADSAQAAMNAAASGHILLSTLHSRDAVGAITSLRNWGIEDQDIAAMLAVVVNQRLVRKLCTECRISEPITEKEALKLQSLGISVPEKVHHAVGCASCGNIGYEDRTGLFEIWRLGEEDYELLLKHTDERKLRRNLGRRGHAFLGADVFDKVSRGITSVEEMPVMVSLGMGSSDEFKS
ncbi:MAG: Flp pilus assembly complex ATPase component TadA [Pirellulales bacterium]|nr:Flp pilus assembly complex ATPase component TadA [Pirellulales bacterium]